MTRRFDRDGDRRHHMQTLCALAHLHIVVEQPIDPHHWHERQDGRDDDDGDRDLAEAGDDWLGEQGFDSIKS